MLLGSQGFVAPEVLCATYCLSARLSLRAYSALKGHPMLKKIAVAALVFVNIATIAPAEARVCRNSHGRHFICHKVIAPRINLKAKHPVKVERCRGHIGRFNNC